MGDEVKFVEIDGQKYVPDENDSTKAKEVDGEKVPYTEEDAGGDEAKTEKRAVTQEDLDADPKLGEAGVNVGDEHEFEVKGEDSSEDAGSDSSNGGERN